MLVFYIVREGLSDKVTSEQRPEMREHKQIPRTTFQAERTASVNTCLVCSRNSKKTRVTMVAVDEVREVEEFTSSNPHKS